MGRSRMFDNEEPEAEDNRSPRTTIVGGRPPETRGDLPPVPTGIQKLLRLAGEDGEFRQVFLQKRGEVAKAAGIDLSTSEKAILAAVPLHQLEAMIDKVPPAAPDRREFFRQTAASAVILLGGASLGHAVSGCDKQQAAAPGPSSNSPPLQEGPYAQPPLEEDDPVRPDHNHTATEGGAAPDEPPEPTEEYPRPDHHHMAPGGARPDIDAGPPPVSRGIQPDMPPPRPDRSETTRGGGAAPDMPPDDF